ncbi:MAG: DNA polymerase I [Verrucomicrobia bacterium]|nr:DNA polymerase I [Verrucomicrobiota bacterium]
MSETPTLYLLDGMALIYRAHFALMNSPIRTASGMNTAALYGFTQTLIDLITTRKPTHLALALDTSEPTLRHTWFPAYKAQRQEVPEDIVAALPWIDRVAHAFQLPVLKYPGYEADDIIGTVARFAETEGITTYMVTPDKDFAQLVSDRTFILKPGRSGSEVECLGVPEICEKWGIQHPRQVIDILGLWGDASDNIPGVPGVGEKTAKKLIAEYTSTENLYDHLDEIKGKLQERLRDNRDLAFLCKKLATIFREVPIRESIRDLAYRGWSEDVVRPLFAELEFNTLGRRIFGDAFKAGHGFQELDFSGSPPTPPAGEQGELFNPSLKTLEQVPHDYRVVNQLEELDAMVATLESEPELGLDLETDQLDPSHAAIVGISLARQPGEGWFIPFSRDGAEGKARLSRLAPLFERTQVRWIGHNLNFDLSVLAWHGVRLKGQLFDTMIAHALLEPDRRHGLDALAEQYLGYTPISITTLLGEKNKDASVLFDTPVRQLADYAVEDVDVALQLKRAFEPMLQQQKLLPVFADIEMPLLPVLVDMEREGIRVSSEVLRVMSGELASRLDQLEQEIQSLAGETFNLNSPKQLGDILFERLKLVEKPRKTKTGQYATNEAVLQELATVHPIVKKLLEHREAAKLKNTYVDALPAVVHPDSGRIHTTYSQVGAATGRLASANPNLQNIPIRTELGQGIRKAFVAREAGYEILSADYSQIELRVMADMSEDEGMIEAFQAGLDIHAATAARVFGVSLDTVTADMRRTAKMVNFGIIFGISSFGLGQRLGMPTREADAIIKAYFEQYPKVKAFMDRTIEQCRQAGFVETKTGRRRIIHDIGSRNATLRNAAERTAINSPIQGTAADMIKLAMRDIARAFSEQNFQSRMLLQVHDELVFDLDREEADAVCAVVDSCMKHALPLRVPVVVDMGRGPDWLAAHG